MLHMILLTTLLSPSVCHPLAPDSTGQVSRIEPVDEADKDVSFLLFRNELLKNIERQDIRAVLNTVSADVQVTSGGRKGVPALRVLWGLNVSPKRFLNELRTVLLLGGRFQDCSFVAPFVFIEFPTSSLDPADYVVVTSDAAALRAGPSQQSEQVGSVHKGDLLRFDAGTKGWIEVNLTEGGRAFVWHADIRTPTSFRAYFAKIMSEWRLVGFFEGFD